MYGIPNMKLDKEDVVQRRVDMLAAEGIEFVTNANVGQGLSGREVGQRFRRRRPLLRRHPAPRSAIEGRDLAGVYLAMEFLTTNTKCLLDGTEMPAHLSAKDRHVVVIGGGDTGTDCVGTSIRHGCKSVVQLEILPKPPAARAANNPWPEWPKIYRMDYGQEEAAAALRRRPARLLHHDEKVCRRQRRPRQRAAHRADRMETRRQRPLLARRCARHRKKSFPDNSCSSPWASSDPKSPSSKSSASTTDDRSNVKADYGKFATSVPGVFAAGDMRRGQSLVVWAINEGRAAARECDRYLMGVSNLP